MRMEQKCQEVEEPGTASQHHKSPPPACNCVRGRWRHRGSRWDLCPGVPRQGLAFEPTPSHSMVRAPFSRLHWHWFDRPHIGRCRPCIGSFDLLLSRSCIGSIKQTGRSIPLWTFQPCVWHFSWAGCWFGGAGNVGHQPPRASRTPAAASARAGMDANEWVSCTSTRVATRVSVGVVLEWHIL